VARFAVTALLALLSAGLVSGGLAGPSGAAGGEAPRLHRVVIQDFAFRPQRLELRPGDSVEWVNLDLAPHTASAEDGAWDSGELARQASFRATFGAAGRFAYLCAFHPMMRGEIVVAP
jgi:plastocyanin